jgi:type VI secretion system secreted protein Hcp
MPIYMGIFEKPNVLSKSLRGNVKAKGYEGWIELESASHEAQRTFRNTVGVNPEASLSHIHEILATRIPDSLSSALVQEVDRGKGRLIVLAFVREDGTTYMKLVLQNTLFASFTYSASGVGIPIESFTLNFTNITFEMSPNSPDTTHSQLYQLGQQKKP